jgi:hypothetical protein
MYTWTIRDVENKSELTEPLTQIPKQHKGVHDCDLGHILTELRNNPTQKKLIVEVEATEKVADVNDK